MSRRERKRRPHETPKAKHAESPVPGASDSHGVTAGSVEAPAGEPTAAEARLVQVETAQHLEFSSGPLPPPRFFQAYEATLPGAAERILAMAEREQKSRHVREARGQWMAFLLALLGLLGGVALVYWDKSLEGLAAMVVSVAIVIGVFITSKRPRRDQTHLPTPPPGFTE